MFLILEAGNRFLNIEYVAHAFVWGTGEDLAVSVRLADGRPEEFRGKDAAAVIKAMRCRAAPESPRRGS